MSVRAKFKCISVLRDETSSNVTFEAVYEESGGVNKSWSKWTPSGVLKMQITNPSAVEQFQPGRYFFLDFTECKKEAE